MSNEKQIRPINAAPYIDLTEHKLDFIAYRQTYGCQEKERCLWTHNIKSVVVPTLEASPELCGKVRANKPTDVRKNDAQVYTRAIQGTLVGLSGVLMNSSSFERGAGRSMITVRVGCSFGGSLGRRAPGEVLKTIRSEREALLRFLICVPLNS